MKRKNSLKNCLIFGASGQIGRNLIRSLTKNNIKVTALTRNIHQKGYILKTQANPGFLEIVEGSIFDHKLIEKLFINADLPTLGKPNARALTGLFLMPRFFLRVLNFAPA